MQVHYDEGVAIHIGPEPCVGVRKDGDEASVGEGIGQPLSRESQSQTTVNKVYNRIMKKELLSVRIAADLKARLDRASDQKRDPYAPTRAKIIERGIELALREIEARKAKR